jgi:plastocyanin/mono/diheme cytochrome c family protein
MGRSSNPGFLAVTFAIALAILLVLLSVTNILTDGLGYKLAAVAVVVAALIYIFYARANNVEKTGYGSLIFIIAVALIIPALMITQQQQQVAATQAQYDLTLQRGAALYGQYCASCHGFQGQGIGGPKLNDNPVVNKFSNDDLTRIISAGIPSDPSTPNVLAMPSWSNRYGGPLTDDDISYLVALIRSSDPAYRATNNLSDVNGFSYVLMSLTNPTQIAEFHLEQKGGSKPQASTFVDLTKQTTVQIDAIDTPHGSFIYGWQAVGTQTANITIKVGTKVTWSNTSATFHNVYQGAGGTATNKFPPSAIIQPNVASSDYSYTFTTPGEYPFYCQIHPAMIGWITVMP